MRAIYSILLVLCIALIPMSCSKDNEQDQTAQNPYAFVGTTHNQVILNTMNATRAHFSGHPAQSGEEIRQYMLSTAYQLSCNTEYVNQADAKTAEYWQLGINIGDRKITRDGMSILDSLASPDCPFFDDSVKVYVGKVIDVLRQNVDVVGQLTKLEDEAYSSAISEFDKDTIYKMLSVGKSSYEFWSTYSSEFRDIIISGLQAEGIDTTDLDVVYAMPGWVGADISGALEGAAHADPDDPNDIIHGAIEGAIAASLEKIITDWLDSLF